jgi:iron complex transport system ATP-binding protein
MTHLTADRLVLGYNGHNVIESLTFDTHPGEMVGLIGPNGVGKTTVLRALAGLLEPRGGAALIDGQDVRALPAAVRAQRLGLVPQGEAHAWPLAVEEIVMLGRAPHRGWLMPLSAADRAVVERALRLTGLTDLRERPIDRLSGGEGQRVRIARALAQEPSILLLDEPTANLDIHHQLQVLELVRRLVDERGLTAIMAIHDLTLAARYCDRLVLLHEGGAYAAGSPEDVLTPENLRAVFGIEAEVYRDPRGHWAISVAAAAH